MTSSERLVTELCNRSFLRLWTHPNPIGKKGKELCDCLVVCGPHIVIVSVKDSEYKDTGDKTGWERWQRAAIDASAAQIWGAERWLKTVDKVIRHDGRTVTLPPKGDRLYHRVSVSLGSHGRLPVVWGDLGHGFVHVCDERSLEILFGGLDTITDYVNFLKASEELVKGGTSLAFAGGGLEDLVALYLTHGRSFGMNSASGQGLGFLAINDDLWSGFVSSGEFRTMQASLAPSYAWDGLIDLLIEDYLTDGMFDMHSHEVTDNQRALVCMALQPRETRASLAEAFVSCLQQEEPKIAARVVAGYHETAFVYMFGSSNDRKFRSSELGLRSLVVRGRIPGVRTVVGLAVDRPGQGGYSFDIAYLNIPDWTSELESAVTGIQNDLGYFRQFPAAGGQVDSGSEGEAF